MSFPKINPNKLKGITGQAYFQYFVNEYLKCIYYPISQEGDFGIDGYIGLVIDENATGKLSGVQIKHGNSYFKNQTALSYKYFGDRKQLNYYSNSQAPIFIVIMNDDFSKMNWIQFDLNKIKLVSSAKWSIEIPKENEIQTNFKEALLNSVSPVIDFEEKLQISSKISIKQETNYETRRMAETRQLMIDYKKMGQMIHQRRKMLGFTQEKLAEKIDISASYMGEIERGTSVCSLSVIVNIAMALELSLDRLIIKNDELDETDTFSEMLDTIGLENREVFMKLCENIFHTLK